MFISRSLLPLLFLTVFHFSDVSGQQTCQSGQYKRGQSCFACPSGTYSSITDARRADCLDCPVNSDCATSSSDGWSTWSCLSGYVFNATSNGCVIVASSSSNNIGGVVTMTLIVPGNEGPTLAAVITSTATVSSITSDAVGNVLIVLNRNQQPAPSSAPFQIDSSGIYVLIGGGVVVFGGSGLAMMLYFRRARSGRNQTLSTLTSPSSMEIGLFRSRQTTLSTVKSASTPVVASFDAIALDYGRVNSALSSLAQHAPHTGTAVTVSSVVTSGTFSTGDDPIPDDLDVEGMRVVHRTLKSFDDFLASTQVYVKK